MKRFNATWMMAAASAVLLTLPATGVAQTSPPPTQPPASTAPPAGASAEMTAGDQAAAQEHLRKASAALAEVKTATLPAKVKTQVAEIKRRLAALERTSAAGDKASATAQANRSAKAKAADNWGTEVAAIDKALTSLLGRADTTGAAPTVTGTSGTPAAPNKAADAIMLDAEAKASLNEVRTHLTAYATAMAGGKTETPTAEPAATEPSAAPSAPTQQPPAITPPAGEPPIAQPPTPQPTAPTTPAQTPSTQTGTDEDAARRHLTEGRNTLSALTQLPAAAQLTGDARTQVAQLISNFNELITTQSQWRESYAKVSANLTSLIGPDSGTSDPVGTSGTAGAVGTSGAASASLDPAVREKLVELRTLLTAFEKAAGGGAPSATSATPTTVPDDTRPMITSPTTPATPPAATTPATEPAPQGTSGAQTPAANADIMRHVAAIDALLKMQDDSGGLTLTKAQVEELRSHWTALRQALDKK
ncbi:hypothetical protein BH24ACI5_BH24ACI5_12290 [soil metagenome]